MRIVYGTGSNGEVEHATAAEAIAVVEAAGSGSVIKWAVEPNLPNCLPREVHRSCALWTFSGGVWRAHSIFDGWGDAYAEEKPR